MSVLTYHTPTETQAISAKWRTLTRQHSKSSTTQLSSSVESQLVPILHDILALAGARIDTGRISETQWSANIRAILDHCIKLRDTIGEQVTSCDYHVAVFGGEAVFDPERMEDEYAGQADTGRRAGPEKSILCTTGLGLVSHEKVQDRDDTKQGGIRYAVRLKAKVVTLDALKDLLVHAE